MLGGTLPTPDSRFQIRDWLQGTLGASSVILPGTTIGDQATLAPLTVPALGSTVKPKAIYMGVPAIPVKVSITVFIALTLWAHLTKKKIMRL